MIEAAIAPSEPIEFADDPTALYRLYDERGTLLYVGITGAPGKRMARHAETQPTGRYGSTRYQPTTGDVEAAWTAGDWVDVGPTRFRQWSARSMPGG
jgi:hypothetical protein